MKEEVSRLLHDFLQAEIVGNLEMSCLNRKSYKNEFFLNVFKLFRERHGQIVANTKRNRDITYLKIKWIYLQKHQIGREECLQSNRFEGRVYDKDDMNSVINNNGSKLLNVAELDAAQSLLNLHFSVLEKTPIKFFDFDPVINGFTCII